MLASSLKTAAAVTLLVMGITAAAPAQFEEADVFDVSVAIDSGLVTNTSDERGVIYSTVVQTPGVAWIRLEFAEALLGAEPVGGQPTIIRVTSLLDGAVQHLDAEQLAQWSHRTAYFNGSALRVELVADPDAAASHVVSDTAKVGPLSPVEPESLCFGDDDRTLSNDPRAGRIMPVQCTAWLINDPNHCFLTAGHCTGNVDTMQFNVPMSSGSGQVQHPGPEDQYPIDPASMQSNGGQGIGNDWAYFGCFENSETGLTAAQAQGDFFVLADTAPAVEGQSIRVTGYGSTNSLVPPEWNKVQKTHAGPFAVSENNVIRYQTDTTGGNSGSPVIDESTGLAIGIHTHAGCNVDGGENQGTAIQHPSLQAALANPQGVCALVPTLEFAFPDGVPDEVAGEGSSFLVQVDGVLGATMEPGTGQLHYDLLDGLDPFTVPLAPQSENVYVATFPVLPCGDTVLFYVSAETDGAVVVTSPEEAPPNAYFATVTCAGTFADINGDGSVDFADILALIGAWGPCPAPPAECAADLDNDGNVAFSDILLVIGNWSP